jgi:hypothetical protein
MDRWTDRAPLPLCANHLGVVADAGRIYALGGFLNQNRDAHNKAFVYEVATDRWREIAPLPRPPRGQRGGGARRVHPPQRSRPSWGRILAMPKKL